MHAEICPVCGGSGHVEMPDGIGTTTVPMPEPCHGCGGKGWVSVGNDGHIPPYYPYYPQWLDPFWKTYTIGDSWPYDSGIT